MPAFRAQRRFLGTPTRSVGEPPLSPAFSIRVTTSQVFAGSQKVSWLKELQSLLDCLQFPCQSCVWPFCRSPLALLTALSVAAAAAPPPAALALWIGMALYQTATGV